MSTKDKLIENYFGWKIKQYKPIIKIQRSKTNDKISFVCKEIIMKGTLLDKIFIKAVKNKYTLMMEGYEKVYIITKLKERINELEKNNG